VPSGRTAKPELALPFLIGAAFLGVYPVFDYRSFGQFDAELGRHCLTGLAKETETTRLRTVLPHDRICAFLRSFACFAFFYLL
jgi:hypothetical protein